MIFIVPFKHPLEPLQITSWLRLNTELTQRHNLRLTKLELKLTNLLITEFNLRANGASTSRRLSIMLSMTVATSLITYSTEEPRISIMSWPHPTPRNSNSHKRLMLRPIQRLIQIKMRPLPRNSLRRLSLMQSSMMPRHQPTIMELSSNEKTVLL